jgi:predicted kinase
MALAPHVAPAPGAVVIRSDVERKRLAGVPWDARLPPGSYTVDASAQTYVALLRRARVALEAGCVVIVDAVSARPDERDAIAALARQAGVPFAGIWLDVPADTARRRVSVREGDASDATAAVVDRQQAYDLGDVAWPRLEAGRDVAAVAADARRLLVSQGVAA